VPRQRIFRIPVVLLFLCVPLFSQAADSQTAWIKYVADGATFTGKVVGVADGDTISVMRGGRAVKVRLHGIDCPEKKQPFGTQAKQFSSDLAFGEEVEVQIQSFDRYGRVVGEVILPDGTSLNQELVRAGFAWWFRKYAPNDPILKELESVARAAKRGLWNDCCPLPPWEWRQIERDRRTKKE
jgi:endonuclease YncB( thermonuclease family)